MSGNAIVRVQVTARNDDSMCFTGKLYCSICCLSVTENPRTFHMSIRDAQTFPAKYVAFQCHAIQNRSK